VILQLNTRYYHDWYSEMRIKLIVWNSFERTSILQSHRNLIHWIITYEMRWLRRNNVTDRSRPTRNKITKERCIRDLHGLACLKAQKPQINAAILSSCKRLQACKKQPLDISNMMSELMLLALRVLFLYNN